MTVNLIQIFWYEGLFFYTWYYCSSFLHSIYNIYYWSYVYAHSYMYMYPPKSRHKYALRLKPDYPNKSKQQFPGGLVVRTQNFHCWGLDSIPVLGTEILYQAAARCGKKIINIVCIKKDCCFLLFFCICYTAFRICTLLYLWLTSSLLFPSGSFSLERNHWK